MLHILSLIFYIPLYNLFIALINVMPGANVGLAIIAITLLVKLALFPLTQRGIYSQLEMKVLEPEVAEIRARVKDKVEQNKQVFALYKEKKVNQLAGCLPLLIQTPFLIAIYIIFQHGFATPAAPLYAFVHAPLVFNLKFLGLTIGSKSWVLAIVAAVATYVQGLLIKIRTGKPAGDDGKAQFAQTLQTQMLYMTPILIGYAAYRFSAAVALYLITSTIFTIGQELYTRKKMKLGEKA